MKLSSFLPGALALSVSAQSAAFTDPATSITFQAFSDPTASYTFGIALPETPTTDFIGVLIGKGTGWAGVSLGGGMTNKLLIASWASGKTNTASFRKVAAYAPPPEVTGTYSITPIASGTYVNATHYSYTFLCKGCILTDGTTFLSNATTAPLGWAYSSKAPVTPANHASSLPKHASQGAVPFNLASAKSANYATWAALATPATAKVAFRA